MPEILKNWVETSTLISIEKQPSLKYKIQVKGETHQLADNPNIKVEFDKYLNNQWNEDKKLYIKDLELYEKYENQSEI